MTSPSVSNSAGMSARIHGRVGEFNLDIQFSAPAKGLTALFGPSGSGKTTVLRCLAGLHTLQGQITVGKTDWQNDDTGVFLPAHKREVGYVFQEASLFHHLSVDNNLNYGLKRSGSHPNHGLLTRDSIIDLLSLEQLLKRYPYALSGGERQRVAIGRALLSQPKLLLMDEPLTAIDRARKDDILHCLETIKASLGIPIIYVSHDIAEVTQLADSIVLINNGQSVASGSVNHMLERLDLHPATGRFEAGVILDTHVTEQDTQYKLTHLDYQGQQISIPQIDMPAGGLVRLRVRARDVSLAVEKPTGISIRNVLAGTVVDLRSESDTAFAETLVDVGGRKLRARITRKSVAELQLSVGSDVYVLIKSISFDGRAINRTRHTTP